MSNHSLLRGWKSNPIMSRRA